MIGWLGTKIGRIVAGIAAAAAILLGAVQFGRKRQRDADKVKKMEDKLHAYETKKEVEDEVKGLTPDERRHRMEQWLRDKDT